MSLFFSWRAFVNKWISYLTTHDNQNLRKQERAPFLVYGSLMYKYQGEGGGGEVTQNYSVTGEGWCKKK